MSGSRRSTRSSHATGTLLAGVLVLFLGFSLPAIHSLQHQGAAGASTHAKNSETPGWILELQTRNARQLPTTVQNDAPSFWI